VIKLSNKDIRFLIGLLIKYFEIPTCSKDVIHDVTTSEMLRAMSRHHDNPDNKQQSWIIKQEVKRHKLFV